MRTLIDISRMQICSRCLTRVGVHATRAVSRVSVHSNARYGFGSNGASFNLVRSFDIRTIQICRSGCFGTPIEFHTSRVDRRNTSSLKNQRSGSCHFSHHCRRQSKSFLLDWGLFCLFLASRSQVQLF